MPKDISITFPVDRNLYFHEQVSQWSVGSLTKDILTMESDDQHLRKQGDVLGFTYTPKPINIFIDSFGGSVYAMNGLMAVIEKCTTPIHTYVTGVAMSAGFMLLISGHRRFAYHYATPLYHQLSSNDMGTLKDLQEGIAEKERLQAQLEAIVLKRTKMPKKVLQQIFEMKKDLYMTPADALKWGVIDEILT